MQNNLVTKQDLKQSLGDFKKELTDEFTKRMSEMSDAILTGIQTMFDQRDPILKKNTDDIADIKSEIRFIKNDIRDLETMLSDKPSRKEFEDLKSQVNRYLTT